MLKDSDWVALPELVKLRLLLLDPDVNYQLDLHYGCRPNQLKFKGERWRMYRTIRQHTSQVWTSTTRNKYPVRLMYTVYGWTGACGFDVIYVGKVGYWQQEWDSYRYLYFLQLPDPPSFSSYHKNKRHDRYLQVLDRSSREIESEDE